ncbi:MAG: DUF6428 family protein [Bacteroidota bacterium]
MKLSNLKEKLNQIEELNFILPNGELVPSHYHVTEVGQVTKHFIDCGGTVRREQVVNFQLWYADDVDHRLQPQKLKNIIAIAEDQLGLQDAEIEVEYQSDTIGKYGLEFKDNQFHLLTKMTDCLASDQCMPAEQKTNFNLSELIAPQNTCAPGSGCC